MFQIVRTEVDGNGHVVGRQPLQPPYDLWEDAIALAEFDASRCEGDYGYDEEHACWWARDNGRNYRFAIEPVAPADQGFHRDLLSGFPMRVPKTRSWDNIAHRFVDPRSARPDRLTIKSWGDT
jgi:hypothetical protein